MSQYPNQTMQTQPMGNAPNGQIPIWAYPGVQQTQPQNIGWPTNIPQMPFNQPQVPQNWSQPVTPVPAPVQVPQQTPSIPCRVVGSLDEIRPNEVPMDGSLSIFVTNDLSRIYARCWNGKGGIDTVEFGRTQPVVEPVGEETQTISLDQIMNKLDEISSLIISKPDASNPSTKKTAVKKEEKVND